MKINIWVQREELWETNKWLTESNSCYATASNRITFFHDKPVKQMDVIQISISIDEYRMIVESNETYDERIAGELGWKQTTTTSVDSLLKYLPPSDYQLGN
tara:strand:- start:1478 stop:1780 length:303 start_codon:yes stop_codon:yes gene_type:complete